MNHSRISKLLTAGSALAALLWAAQPVSAQSMPSGGSKMWPWNVMGYQGYREPAHAATPKDPSAAPVAAKKYQVAVMTVPQQTPDEFYANRALLMAHLPENGQVWFQGKETATKGTMREFMSPPLAADKDYTYSVRVDWVEDGQKVTQTHEFNVKAGAIHCVYLVDANSTEAEVFIEENLKKLSPEDRKLAEAQRFCPIQENNRLGVMGVPGKVMIKGEAVFLCCQPCARKALNNPEETLAKVKALRAKNGEKQ